MWETLDHPNLLSLVAFYIDFEEGILQFVSEYAEAGNVSQYLNDVNPDMPTRLLLVSPVFGNCGHAYKIESSL